MNIDLGQQLADSDRQLWSECLRLESAGLRRDAITTLERLVQRVLAYSPDKRREWVEALCAEHWSDPVWPWVEGKLNVRYPLLRGVILPELLDGYRRQRPRYARWLALFYLSREARLVYDEMRLHGMPELHAQDLLREALATDPSDEQAARALIFDLERSFDFMTHEVPLGVLTDDTPAWRVELDEFERLVGRYPVGRDFRVKLRGWRLHCDAWEEYLQRSNEFENYAEFLDTRDS